MALLELKNVCEPHKVKNIRVRLRTKYFSLKFSHFTNDFLLIFSDMIFSISGSLFVSLCLFCLLIFFQATYLIPSSVHHTSEDMSSLVCLVLVLSYRPSFKNTIHHTATE